MAHAHVRVNQWPMGSPFWSLGQIVKNWTVSVQFSSVKLPGFVYAPLGYEPWCVQVGGEFISDVYSCWLRQTLPRRRDVTRRSAAAQLMMMMMMLSTQLQCDVTATPHGTSTSTMTTAPWLRSRTVVFQRHCLLWTSSHCGMVNLSSVITLQIETVTYFLVTWGNNVASTSQWRWRWSHVKLL